MSVEEGRRVRALLSIVEKPVEKLAEDWGVDRKRLIDVMYGRLPLVEDVVGLLHEKLGISPTWLRAGKGSIFDRRSPGPRIERAIELQLRYGQPRVGGVPLFEGVEEATPDRRSKGGWREHARRGVMPAADVSKKGFFFVAGQAEAKVVGCEPGAFVLFLPAESMLTPMRVEVGDVLVCIVVLRNRKLLRRMEIVASTKKRKKTKKTIGTTPEPSQYDIKFDGRTTYYLRCVDALSPPVAGAEVVAIALTAEIDLVARKGEK